jgi:superfamily I DNA and/or RNA helicase
MTLEEKIARAEKVNVYYPGPYETKYAIMEYWGQKGKPLKVAGYYVYGEELKAGKPLVCWYWQPSFNSTVLEDNFSTEEEAKARMKELRKLRKSKEVIITNY